MITKEYLAQMIVELKNSNLELQKSRIGNATPLFYLFLPTNPSFYWGFLLFIISVFYWSFLRKQEFLTK
jgi:hypothetical protein